MQARIACCLFVMILHPDLRISARVGCSVPSGCYTHLSGINDRESALCQWPCRVHSHTVNVARSLKSVDCNQQMAIHIIGLVAVDVIVAISPFGVLAFCWFSR